MMFAAVRDRVITNAGYSSAIEGLRDVDVSAVDLSVPRGCVVPGLAAGWEPSLDLTTDEGLAALVDEARGEDVSVCGLLLPTDFGREDVENEIAWVVQATEIARALDCPVIRIDAVMHGERELPMEQRRTRFARCMDEILARTDEGAPVDFGIENHGFQGNDPEFLQGVFDSVPSERFGLCMDTGNFYWSGEPLSQVYEILERFAPKTKQTHAKNINYPAEIREQTREMGYEYHTYCAPIPDGDIDHEKVVGFLRAAGYDRGLCCEDESIDKFPEGERKAVLARDMEYLKGLV
jgi:sugar phosphate isomerase/epimerase